MITRALGRRPARHDARTLRLATYLDRLDPSVPAPPPSQDWTAALPADVGDYRNREIGICAFASAAHIIRTWNAENGAIVVPSQLEVESAYSDVGAYDPAKPETWDNGADMLSVLRYWTKNGIAGRKIRAFLKLDHDNIEQIKIAHRLFGPLYAGASLPISAKRQIGSMWVSDGRLTCDSRIGSWGGHAMACARLDRTGGSFFTWGKRQRFGWRWWLDYIDEVYCMISDDWFGVGGLSPNGFDMGALLRDLAALRAA